MYSDNDLLARLLKVLHIAKGASNEAEVARCVVLFRVSEAHELQPCLDIECEDQRAIGIVEQEFPPLSRKYGAS